METCGLQRCIGRCFAHICVAYVISLRRTVWALWNAGGRKTVFSKMNFDPKNIFAEEVAEIPLARLWAVPRYYFRCKAESA